MAFTYHDDDAASAWATSVQSPAIDVTEGDLIVAMASFWQTSDGCTFTDNASGGSNTYYHGGVDFGVEGVTGLLTFGYAIAKATESIQVTATWANPGGSNRCVITVVSVTPDSGETVSLDKFMYADATGADPTTSSLDTTGDDEFCVAALSSTLASSSTNHEIPDGTAADADLTSGHGRLVAWYSIFNSTVSGCEASADQSSTTHSIQMVCFKSEAGGESTAVPTTPPPTTSIPTSVAPTTSAPTTLEPTTLAPTTLEPTTLPPTTLEPTTLPPTTLAPTTLAPTTLPPTTLEPTTLAPTTLPPTTLEPTTLAPTTLPPTTLAPTTLAPTTLPPTTLAPTTYPDEYWETCFGEYALSAQPSDWTERWHTTVASSIVDSGGKLGGKKLVETHSSVERYYLSWDTPGPDYSYVNNTEILAKVMTTDGSSIQEVRIVIHGAGGTASENGYLLDLLYLDNEIRITEFSSGSSSALGADVAFTLNANTWYWVRFRRNGNDLKGKIWEDGASEPGSWTIERTDGSTFEGRVGIGGQIHNVHCDWFSVCKGGGTARSPQDILECTTAPPTTIAPTTLEPTTLPPTTLPPTTLAPTTLLPTTLAPTTTAPTTLAPTTEAPTSVAPTTSPPTSLAPTTGVPTSLAPTTEPSCDVEDIVLDFLPTTAVPTTLPPTTLAPTTEAPTTSAPTTVVPTTEPPTTAAPTTSMPTTVAPTTEAPTTEAPTTAISTTTAPTSLAPTTTAPTSVPPTTGAPTTSLPTSIAPTTEVPTTGVFTTPIPTSVGPTTGAPTTSAFTTLAPTTIVPTTEVPTTQVPTTVSVTTLAPTTIVPTTFVPTTPAPTTEAPTCVKLANSLITDELMIDSIITDELTINSLIADELTINSLIC